MNIKEINEVANRMPLGDKIRFKQGAVWVLEHLWKDAQGDDLPPIDKEVIVLCNDNFGGYKVCFGHRPNPKGYYGKNLTTGEKVSKYRYEVETYDKSKIGRASCRERV